MILRCILCLLSISLRKLEIRLSVIVLFNDKDPSYSHTYQIIIEVGDYLLIQNLKSKLSLFNQWNKKQIKLIELN